MADASWGSEEGGGARGESERARPEVAKMEQAIESDISKAMVGLREHFRGERSTPSRGHGGGTPEAQPPSAEGATIAAFRSEAAAARDDMLDGLSRLRRDLEAHRRTAEPQQAEAELLRRGPDAAAAQLRRVLPPEQSQPPADSGAEPSASGGLWGLPLEVAQLRAGLVELGARVAALEMPAERMRPSGVQPGDVDATLQDPLATQLAFLSGDHALAQADRVGSSVSRDELCALIADEVRSHTERMAGCLRGDAMAHNVELRADFARRLEVVEEELRNLVARGLHDLDITMSPQPQRQRGAGGADEARSARVAGEDSLIPEDLKQSLELLVEKVSETLGTPTGEGASVLAVPAVTSPSGATPCATGHGEAGGSLFVQTPGGLALRGDSPIQHLSPVGVQATPLLGGHQVTAIVPPGPSPLPACYARPMPAAAAAAYPGGAPAAQPQPVAVTAVASPLAQHVVALPVPRASVYPVPYSLSPQPAPMLRREEDEGAMNRSVLGIDASRPCSPVELEAQRLQAGAVEAQALGASARTPGLFESKEMFQKCLQELREENDALRMGNSLGRTEMFARPAGLSTMPGGMAPSPQPTMVRSYSPRARAPPAPQVIVHRQPRASSPLRGVASAPQGQVRQRSPSPLRAGA